MSTTIRAVFGLSAIPVSYPRSASSDAGRLEPTGRGYESAPMLGLLGMTALASALVGASTVASERWGHGIGGVLSAFPLIVGPVLLIGALRHGTAFASQAAAGTLLGLVALGGFAWTYGHCAVHRGWWTSLAAAWVAAAGLGVLAGRAETGVAGALAVAVASLAAARIALPRRRRPSAAPVLPGWELPLRMALTALLIVSLSTAGTRFGPTAAGVLSALPALASVLAAFTHARGGSDALLELLRGMLSGMAAFVTFCAVVGLLVESAGVAAAFGVAAAAALTVHAAAAYSPLTHGGAAPGNADRRP